MRWKGRRGSRWSTKVWQLPEDYSELVHVKHGRKEILVASTAAYQLTAERLCISGSTADLLAIHVP
jgi:hypothetical protein